MPDDISLVANVKGKGVVIITGCSHAGIINARLENTRF
jgi:7,8-dihydropterin-6-yl-methyl-4-(beta-D-ribofuranosyl)aminobenzene 5'-phosphate synthase